MAPFDQNHNDFVLDLHSHTYDWKNIYLKIITTFLFFKSKQNSQLALVFNK